MNATTSFPSKPRYEILDGLRGVAALIVVGYHLCESYSAGPRLAMFNHGYLAVDFFFVLSGFVIGYAYDDRWKRMSTWEFCKRRIARLHPMLILGTLVGALLFYFGDGPKFPAVADTPWWQVGVFFALESLMITGIAFTLRPTTPCWDIRGWQEMNSLNGSAWSLYWEYIANILYALVFRHFSKLMLTLAVIISAFPIIDISLHLNVFGLLDDNRDAIYTVFGGFGTTPEHLYIALSRLIYPFFMGLLLSRCNMLLLRTKRGFWWCSLIIAALLCVPCIGPASKPWIDGAYNMIAVLFLFPLVVSLGAGSPISGKRTTAICKWLGDISYPLYITHYPWIYIQSTWAASHPDAPVGTHIAVGVSLFILVVAIAQASLKLYDEPVREWLRKHWLTKK